MIHAMMLESVPVTHFHQSQSADGHVKVFPRQCHDVWAIGELLVKYEVVTTFKWSARHDYGLHKHIRTGLNVFPEFILDEDVWCPDAIIEPLFSLNWAQQQVCCNISIGEGQALK